MTQLIYGDRIGQTAQISTGCSAVVWDADGKILLTRRADNGFWCLPGGRVEAGENVEEACIREVREETGLHVRIQRLIGVYSSPHRVVQDADGHRFQIINLTFAAEISGGDLTLNEEVSEFSYFKPEEIPEIPLNENHRERISDAISNQALPFIR